MLTSAQNLTKDMFSQEELSGSDTQRHYIVLKEGDRYKIVVKPCSKRKASQKIYYLRGYMSQRCAKQDVLRLIAHLQTKRLQTFEKSIGQEYDITPPSKKRKSETLHIVSAAKELQGVCINQLYQRLRYSYYSYRTQPVLLDSKRLSKKEWMRKQSEMRIKDTCYLKQTELEQDIRTESALTYLHQRLQLLETRKQTNSRIIKGLRECFYTGSCFKKIREFVPDEEKEEDIIDLTDDRPVFTLLNTTKAQLTRITLQCFVTYNMMQKLESRAEDEMKMLKAVLNEATHILSGSEERKSLQPLLLKHEAAKSAYRVNNNMMKMSDDVRLLFGGYVSSKTIRIWYHEYIEKESFQENCRGSHASTTFIEEYGYSHRF